MNKLNINLITNYIKNNNLTIKQFCTMCNISLYTYKTLIKCQNIKISKLVKIVKIIGCSLDSMLFL